ncbi:hypothetical protein EIP91_001981 [Steccherinum ochraceum]|uniref:DUF6589 domain-containing protein n=1 Tax=Steccherinum ochraceum TaxID=92696 RepID=A0A4R0RD22_9APHY|nr:hypothetical protein EIP91_001981 [Steccherinum ochraceum]
MLTAEENMIMQTRYHHTVLRILVKFGGDRFARFQKEVDDLLPTTKDKIPVCKTKYHPLPTMDIDESRTSGNADVVEAMFKELGHSPSADNIPDTVRILFGDQLSIARLRSVTAARAGHDSYAQSLLHCIFGPGIFHYIMAGTSGLLEEHHGAEDPSPRDPGSLAFHNVALTRKPITITSLPPFRTCRDLIFVSLYARVFHLLEKVSGKEIDEYAKEVTFEKLSADAFTIVDTFANPEKTKEIHEELDMERLKTASDTHSEPAEPQAEDEVFKKATLCLRDSLILRELTDAIKVGDSGRMVTALKLLAVAYRGTGRTKYAHECLHLLHHIIHVWTDSIRNTILKNWLVNTTGKPDGFLPVDLLQEHLNYWIKIIYRAHGSNASWEWLANIAPTIEILRRLATQMNRDLGSRQGSKHATPDLWRDISVLMKSLKDHNVYGYEPGRVIEDKDGNSLPARNIISEGWNGLKQAVAEYNKTFEKQRERRSEVPLVGKRINSELTVETAPIPHSTPSPPALGAASVAPGPDTISDTPRPSAESMSPSERAPTTVPIEFDLVRVRSSSSPDLAGLALSEAGSVATGLGDEDAEGSVVGSDDEDYAFWWGPGAENTANEILVSLEMEEDVALDLE